MGTGCLGTWDPGRMGEDAGRGSSYHPVLHSRPAFLGDFNLQNYHSEDFNLQKLRLVALAELVELVLEYWYWSEPEVLVPGGTGTGGSTSATRRSF